MGIWNDISGVLNRGMEGAGRIADTTSLKFKLGEVERRRRDLAADLGESLYASVESGSELPAECERIIADMRACDVEISQVKAGIERIARESDAAKAASVAYSCPSCGASLSSGARFCHACGTALAPVQTAPQAPFQDASASQASAASPSSAAVDQVAVPQSYEIPSVPQR